VNASRGDQSGLWAVRQSTERMAAQRFLTVVAAEARRLNRQRRAPEPESGTRAPFAPAEPQAPDRVAPPTTRLSI
jgi:hypothetical protein